MKIYKLEKTAKDDILFEYHLVDKEQDDYFFQPYLGTPRRVKEEWPKIELKKVDGKIPGDYLFVSGIPGLIINERALKILSKYFQNCEMLDIYVDGVKHYYINVLNTVDCFDKENSNYRDKVYFGKARFVMVNKFALLKENLKDKDIFRVSLEILGDGVEPQMDVFVSEKFKNTVKEAGLNGFKFVEVPVR